MNSFSVILFLALVVVAFQQVLALDNNSTCVPNETFIGDDGCNVCHCPPSGTKKYAACTRMACESHCVPGVSFKASDGCNTCVCPPNGMKSNAACTLMACNITICIPGTTFNDKCNTCRCPESGKRSEAPCTLKACS